MTHPTDYFMHHKHAKQPVGMVGAVTIAALAGVAAGVLLAPRKGSETRQQIKDRIERAKQRSEERLAETKTKAQQGVDKLAHKADDIQDDVSDAVTEARSQVEDAATEVKTRTRKPTPPAMP